MLGYNCYSDFVHMDGSIMPNMMKQWYLTFKLCRALLRLSERSFIENEQIKVQGTELNPYYHHHDVDPMSKQDRP